MAKKKKFIKIETKTNIFYIKIGKMYPILNPEVNSGAPEK
jgi:hypothetical protein